MVLCNGISTENRQDIGSNFRKNEPPQLDSKFQFVVSSYAPGSRVVAAVQNGTVEATPGKRAAGPWWTDDNEQLTAAVEPKQGRPRVEEMD